MKKLEKEILAILKSNARAAIEDIAKMVNSTVTEVSQILERLEKTGAIVQYTAVINEKHLSYLGNKVRALIELRIRPEKKTGFDRIAKRIAGFPQVVDHYLISGNYDFLIIVEGETLEEISRFVSEKLASIENVNGTATHFIMKKYKERGVVIEDLPQDRLLVSP